MDNPTADAQVIQRGINIYSTHPNMRTPLFPHKRTGKTDVSFLAKSSSILMIDFFYLSPTENMFIYNSELFQFVIVIIHRVID